MSLRRLEYILLGAELRNINYCPCGDRQFKPEKLNLVVYKYLKLRINEIKEIVKFEIRWRREDFYLFLYQIFVWYEDEGRWVNCLEQYRVK
jgi:hypothetical protein